MKKSLAVLAVLGFAVFAWRPSGATVTLVAVSGGVNEVYVSTLTPFHVGQFIRLDDEVMLVTGEGVALGTGFLRVVRWQRTTHADFTPIYVRAGGAPPVYLQSGVSGG